MRKWQALKSGTQFPYMRVSRSSGYWQIRARGRYNNKEYISNVVDVEERFPTASEIARHPEPEKYILLPMETCIVYPVIS